MKQYNELARNLPGVTGAMLKYAAEVYGWGIDELSTNVCNASYDDLRYYIIDLYNDDH